VTVGGVGVFAIGMSMLGYGGSAMASVAGSANLVGMLLSMPGSWAIVYQGAYELSAQPVTTGDAATDHLLQLQYNEGFATDEDYLQN